MPIRPRRRHGCSRAPAVLRVPDRTYIRSGAMMGRWGRTADNRSLWEMNSRHVCREAVNRMQPATLGVRAARVLGW